MRIVDVNEFYSPTGGGVTRCSTLLRQDPFSGHLFLFRNRRVPDHFDSALSAKRHDRRRIEIAIHRAQHAVDIDDHLVRTALHPLRGRIVKPGIRPVSIDEDGIIHDCSPDDTSRLMSASNEGEDARFPHAVRFVDGKMAQFWQTSLLVTQPPSLSARLEHVGLTCSATFAGSSRS